MSPSEVLTCAPKMSAKQVEKLSDAYKKAVEAPSDGGYIWHGPNDIQNMTGLGGQFLWTENPQAPVTMSFTVSAGPDGTSADGTYTLATLVGVTVEQGDVHAIPNNPAIGWALIYLTPQGADTRVYMVEGMLTPVGNWTIINMELENAGSQQEFWATRMS